MQFVVHPEIFERFPGVRLTVVIAHGIDNQADRPEVAASWQATWTDAAKAAVYGNAQSHPREDGIAATLTKSMTSTKGWMSLPGGT